MNYLHKILKDYFEEITKVEGFLLTVEGFINYSNNKLRELYPETTSINSLISSFRDLSDLSNVLNLHDTGFMHEYTLVDIKNDLSLIVSRECCFSLSQVYEIFETFIKEILKTFFLNNPSYIDLLDVKNVVKPTTILEYGDYVNALQKKGRNNKKLLWALRKISTFYSNHETNNIWKFNMAQWYELVSVIRHAIVHNRQELTQSVQEEIIKNKNSDLFDRYYLKDMSYNKNIIFTNRVKTGKQICLFNQYAYLIFKSLSEEVNLDSKYYI